MSAPGRGTPHREDLSVQAITFVHQVGGLAESEGHHPEISFGWGYVFVSLRTKKIKGLHENDFIMAAKIDRLAQLGGTGGDAQEPVGKI